MSNNTNQRQRTQASAVFLDSPVDAESVNSIMEWNPSEKPPRSLMSRLPLRQLKTKVETIPIVKPFHDIASIEKGPTSSVAVIGCGFVGGKKT